MKMNRRDFLKYSIAAGATVVVGSRILGLQLNEALAAIQTQTLKVTITDALKNMVTDNAINTAKCYFWVYKMKADSEDGEDEDLDIPVEVPGPNIFTTQGDTVSISIKNDLDEDHAFFIPGIFDSGPISPGKTVETSFTATKSGAFLYYDNLNEPVNRVMGLHGAFIVMPGLPQSGHKYTPYDSPTPGVQKLFDDFGSSAHWPGLAWEKGYGTVPGDNGYAPPFRQYIWLLHQASPNLFAEVGKLPPGEIYDAQKFVNAFLKDPFSPTNAARTPQYFTINGQSGHFSHNNPYICPNLRAGEPCVIHVMNAGLMSHSMHLHANHFFVTFDSKNGGVQDNPIWIDVYTLDPMSMVDYTIPYMRPPDVPNERGIGNIDIPGEKDKPLKSLKGKPVWPPSEEIAMFIPKMGEKAGVVPIHVQLSPLCYPMHDHSEPSQTSQGGNYNLGMISGMNFTGDRNLAGVVTFPNPPKVFGPDYKKLLELAA